MSSLEGVRRCSSGGPWFEEFNVGQVFEDAPGADADRRACGAAPGDRRRPAAAGARRGLVPRGDRSRTAARAPQPRLRRRRSASRPGRSQRVRGNLFYRGSVLAHPIFIGETLRTRTEIVGLKQNRRRAGRAGDRARRDADAHDATSTSEPGARLLALPDDPAARPELETGHADDFDGIPAGARSRAGAAPRLPPAGGSSRCATRVPGPHHGDLEPGRCSASRAGETVTGAPELARLTLNVATAHTDATGSAATASAWSTAATRSRSRPRTRRGRCRRSRRSSPGTAASTSGRCSRATSCEPS